MINYIIEKKRWFRSMCSTTLTPPNLISDKFKFDDGLFGGYDAGKRSYDKATWTYGLDDKRLPKKDPTLCRAPAASSRCSRSTTPATPWIKKGQPDHRHAGQGPTQGL